MKRIFFILIVFTMSFVLLGCATAPKIHLKSEIGHELVERILSAYTRYEHRVFTQFFAEDYEPRFLGNQIEANSCKEQNVSYEVYTDSVIQTKKNMDVAFRWHKKRYSLVTIKEEEFSGTAHFIFKKSGEDWKLFKITGDNPLVN